MDVERGVSGVLTYGTDCAGADRPCRSSRGRPPSRCTTSVRPRRVEAAPRRRHPADGDHLGQPRLGAERELDALHERAAPLRHLFNMLRENPLADKRDVPAHEHDLGAPPARAPRRRRAGRDRGQGGLLRGQLPDGGRPGHLAGLRRSAGRLPARDGLRQPGDLRPHYKRADHDGLSLSSVVNGLLLLFTVRAAAPGGQAARRGPEPCWPARRGEPADQVARARGGPAADRSRSPSRPACRRSCSSSRCCSAWSRSCIWPRRIRGAQPVSARQFLRISVLGVAILAGATVLFLLVDTRYGVEAAPAARGAARLLHLQGAGRPRRAVRGDRGAVRRRGGGELPAADQPRPAQHRGLRGLLRDGAASHAARRRGGRRSTSRSGKSTRGPRSGASGRACSGRWTGSSRCASVGIDEETTHGEATHAVA